MEGKNENFLSQISRSEYIEIKRAWKLNYGGLLLWRFIFEEAFCVLQIGNKLFFIFGRLYLVIDVSYGDGKGVIVLSLLALLCGVNNFVQEELFLLMIFTL